MGDNMILEGKNLAIKTIKNKIEGFISSGIYVDLDEFINDNPDLNTFQEKTKLNNSLRRIWGYQITDEDYQNLISELKKELEEKMKIVKDNLTTVEVNGKEITTYNDDNRKVIVDNSYSNRSIEDELPILQQKYSKFRNDGINNTANMMEFMRDEIKPSPGFEEVSSLSTENLPSHDTPIAQVAQDYQISHDNNNIQVDFENRLILDGDDVLSIEKRDDGYGVFAPENNEMDLEQTNDSKEKVHQKTIQKNPLHRQAGFSNIIVLALLAGMLMGVVLLNVYIKII